jgi:hypothetical protein
LPQLKRENPRYNTKFVDLEEAAGMDFFREIWVTRKALTCVNAISGCRQLRSLIDPWNPSVTVVRRSMLHVECTPELSDLAMSPALPY